MRLKSKLYIAAGFLNVGLGIAGIPLPLLPTTPFLLLAAFCFARGSDRWHQWLLAHPTLSPYILAFREKRGLTRQQKWRIAGLLTLTMFVTGAFSPHWLGKVLAFAFWLGWIIALFCWRTAEENYTAHGHRLRFFEKAFLRVRNKRK